MPAKVTADVDVKLPPVSLIVTTVPACPVRGAKEVIVAAALFAFKAYILTLFSYSLENKLFAESKKAKKNMTLFVEFGAKCSIAMILLPVIRVW